MPNDNHAIAAVFSEIADRLEIRGDNPFRIRAYRNAARIVTALPRELRDMVTAEGTLPHIPGIGHDLTEKIMILLHDEPVPLLERLRSELPAGLMDMLKVQGLGPKRVQRLYLALNITSLADLERAVRAGKLRELPGFGAGIERQVLASLAVVSETARRRLRAAVQPEADGLLQRLSQSGAAGRLTVAGSLRRAAATVGDVDILATAVDAAEIMQQFVAGDEVATVLAQGPTRAAVQWHNGLQVDLRVVAPEAYGAALHYFTGSKAHNIAIRRLGQERGLKVNEYGVFRAETPAASAADEADVFAAVGLPWIPPELREDQGEIAAARENRLPALVEYKDLRGDLHVHSSDSDGSGGLSALAAAAAERGYEYCAVTDHSRSLAVAHGLDEKRLLQQVDAIDRFNAEGGSPVTVLKGIEVEIMENGGLDLPDDILQKLDLVIGAVHSHFGFSARKQTERILHAMDHRCFTILAHPSGRLLLERAPLELDMPRIIEHARQRGCALELNAQPRRLDMDEIHCRMAREQRVPVCINSDAHCPGDMQNVVFGVGQARRGWLETADVLNALPLDRLRQRLAAMR